MDGVEPTFRVVSPCAQQVRRIRFNDAILRGKEFFGDNAKKNVKKAICSSVSAITGVRA